jgi:hypothetical protein
MYSIKFGVHIVEYSVFSVEYYWVVTGSKAWKEDLWRSLQNQSIIHWIFHLLPRAVWFMNSLQEVSQKKQNKKETTRNYKSQTMKVTMGSVSIVPSCRQHRLEFDTDNKIMQCNLILNLQLL